LGTIKQPCLIIGIASDGLFTADEQIELSNGIPNSIVRIIESGEGHDGFLLEFVQIRELIGSFIRENSTFQMCNVDTVEQAGFEITHSVFGEAEGDMLLW
jgi:homoserine O-acetyltransferase